MSTSKKANNFLSKFDATVKDTFNEYTKGFVKFEEGVVDTLAGTAAWATKKILPGVSESLQAFVERDLTNELYNRENETVLDKVLDVAEHIPQLMPTVKGIQALTGNYQLRQTYDQEDSKLDAVNVPLSKVTNGYLNDITLREVVGQVGNMTPTIMLGGAAKAAGWGTAGIKAASVGSLGVSATGGSMQEALNDGANIGQAVGYGYAKGAVEAGTELLGDSMGIMFGGGGGLLDKIIPATTIGAKLARGVLEEGGEEAISSAVDPFIKQIYDKDSIRDTFTTREGLKGYTSDIFNSAIMGGVTSLAMAPLGSGNIVDDVETKKTLTERARQLEANGKLTTEKATKLNEQIAKVNANIETKLKKMNETERAKTIAALKLNGFDDSGAYVQKTYERAKYSTIGTETHNVNEIASKAGFETSTELTQDQERVFGTVKKNLAKLQAKGLDTDGIVVVKENQTNAGQTFAGANANGIIFVNENRLNELSSALQTLAHESTHSLPMSFETLSLLDAVMNDEANGQAVRDVLTNYDVTQEEWNNAKKAFGNGTSDARQAKIVDETGAAFSENILGNEDAMRVLTRNNSGLVVKAYNAICDAIKLKQLTGAAKSEYKLMLDYAKAFEKAMASEGIDFVPMSDDRDDDEAKYSVKANDAEYTELAKEPEANKARLQEMVDAAAKEAGYEYRRSSRKQNTADNGTGFMMFAKTDYSEDLEGYGKYKYAAKGTNAVDIKTIFDELKDISEEYFGGEITDDEINPPDIVDTAGIWDDTGFMAHLYDLHLNLIADGVKTQNGLILLSDFSNGIVKSADPVTYDDNGNVIPLSERFNTQNDDIRYSVKKKSPISAENYRIVKQAIKGIDVTDAEAVAMEAYKQHNPIRNWTKENAAEAERAERINSSSRERVAAVMSYNADVLNTENGKAIAENYGITQEELDELRARREEAEKEADAKKAQSSRKSYSYEEAQGIIDKVIDNLSDEKSYADLPKTTRRVLTSTLLHTLNSTRDNRAGYVKDIADRIIKDADIWNAEEVDAQNDYVRSGDYENDMHELEILKSYLRKIDVKNIKGEIKYKYDDKAKSVLKRWASNIATENPVTADTVLHDNNELHLKDVQDGDNEADIFFAINNRYEDLKARTEKVKPYKLSFQDEQAKNRYAVELMTELLNEADALGKNTETTEEQYSEYIAKYLAQKETARQIENAEERAAFAESEMAKMESNLAEATKKSQRTANLIHKISKKADYLKGLTNRKYAEKYNIPISALIYKNEEFKSIANEFSNIFNSKDGISPRKVRTRLAEFINAFGQSKIYNEYISDYVNAGEDTVNMMMENLTALAEEMNNHLSEKGVFDQDPLAYEELECMERVLDFVTNIYINYDSLTQDGKRKSLTEEAKKFETVQSVVKDLNRKKSNMISAKGFAAAASTPIAVAEHMDAYQHGLFTDTVERLTYDTWVRNRNRLYLAKGLNNFVSEHKGYRRHLRQFMQVGNVEMQIGEFMDSYFMATQENGQLTLFGEEGGGLTYTGKDKVVTTKGTKFTKEQFETAYQSLDQTDKDFMDLVWKVYQDGGKYKSVTDIALTGFTVVKGDGNYYQLSRDKGKLNSYAGDASKSGADVQSVLNLNINKARKKSARVISLQATNILNKTFKYIADVTNYNAYAVDVSNFRRLYNFKLDGKTQTLRGNYDALWDSSKDKGAADAYISKWLDDVQEVGRTKGQVSKAISKYRGYFAQAQLGLNLNVIMGQFASYPMALAYLDVDDLAYGIKYFFSKEARAEMDRYSMLAEARAANGDAISANTLAEVTGAIGRVEGFLTGAMDRATLTCLFEATVHKFRKENPNMTVDEVYKNAAEYFDKTVVTRTQPTWQASDRSSWMRTDSDIMKVIMAFRSVPLKQVTELISSVDRLHVMNQLSDMKLTDEQKAAGVTVDVKGAQIRLAKVSVGIIAANVVYAIFKQLVKHITDRDDEEDNYGANWYEQIGNQFVLTTMTMFPIIGDMAAAVTPAFGGGKINNFSAFSMPIIDDLNDIVDIINELYELGDNTSQETLRLVKKIVFEFSGFFGLSTRNVWNQLTGMISQFSPSTGETIDSWFYKQSSYASKMKKAVENGDTKMINTILQIQSGVDGLPSVYNSLMENGYVDILPRSVGTSFTYDGEQYEMTKKEQAQFRETYTGYAKAVSDMARTVVFKTATDEVKAKAIKAIQNTYWQMAIDETVGDETTAKLYVFSKAISIGKLAVITEACKAYSADKDDEGHSIAGSKKAKIVSYLRQSDLNQAQQAMVLAYLGYTDSSAKQKVRAYINSLNITKEEKAILFAMCGY